MLRRHSNLGLSRAYELMKIARGERTVEQTREIANVRDRKYKQNQKGSVVATDKMPEPQPMKKGQSKSRIAELGCNFDWEHDKAFDDEAAEETRRRAAHWAADEALRLAKDFSLRRPE